MPLSSTNSVIPNMNGQRRAWVLCALLGVGGIALVGSSWYWFLPKTIEQIGAISLIGAILLSISSFYRFSILNKNDWQRVLRIVISFLLLSLAIAIGFAVYLVGSFVNIGRESRQFKSEATQLPQYPGAHSWRLSSAGWPDYENTTEIYFATNDSRAQIIAYYQPILRKKGYQVLSGLYNNCLAKKSNVSVQLYPGELEAQQGQTEGYSLKFADVTNCQTNK